MEIMLSDTGRSRQSQMRITSENPWCATGATLIPTLYPAYADDVHCPDMLFFFLDPEQGFTRSEQFFKPYQIFANGNTAFILARQEEFNMHSIFYAYRLKNTGTSFLQSQDYCGRG